MLGNLVVEAVAWRHAEPDDLCPATHMAQPPSDVRICPVRIPESPHGYGRCWHLSVWWRRAKIAAWTRSCRASLVRMLRTWVLTVCSPIARSRAICRLL